MIDQFHDAGWGRMADLLAHYPKAAALVKTVDPGDGEKLASTAFAWPAARRFPVHEKRAAVLSYLYASTQPGVPEPVVREIKTALQAYGVPDEVFERVETKVAAVAAEDCLFPHLNSWPIRTVEEVKQAELRLLEERVRLQPEARVEAFSRLYRRAEKLGAELSPASYRYAGMVETDAATLRDSLRARAEAAVKTAVDKTIGDQVRDKMLKLAEAVAKKPSDVKDRGTRTKLAAAIYELDRTADLPKLYDRGIPDPVATVFNTEKTAFSSDLDLGTMRISSAKLAGLPASFYGDVLGDDFARELAPHGRVSQEKISEIIPTLPADMKRILVQGLNSAGYR